MNHDWLPAYRRLYGLSDITAEQASEHLRLERELTRELLDSAPDRRWTTFESAYDRLYGELPWLAGTGAPPFEPLWSKLVGPPPLKIYEVGSGSGQLAHALAAIGHDVEATDVSRHRGTREESVLRWSVTDGVHLEEFAARAPYDVVISDQVVEHLHPDDVGPHFRGARAILRDGGRYICRTPHAFSGPHDVSCAFGFDRPVGMHLREYTNHELLVVARSAGFAEVRAVLWTKLPRSRAFVTQSRRYLRALLAVERGSSRFEMSTRRRIFRKLRGPVRLDVFLVFHTRDTPASA